MEEFPVEESREDTREDLSGLLPEDILVRWRNEPLLFVKEALGADPDDWQDKALRGLKTQNRLAIRSGHGVGKTAFISWVVLWWLTTRTPSRVITMSASERQLKTVTWPEIAMWARRLPEPFPEQVEIAGETIYLHGLKSQNFCVPVVCRRDTPEALQGFHSKHQLIIGDEASGIPDNIFVTGEGSMSTEGAKTLLCGNPTRVSGYFNDCFERDRGRWWRLTVNSEEAKMVSPLWLRDMKKRYGKMPNVYRPRVLGLPPMGDEEGLITRDSIMNAIGRDVALDEYHMVVWGLDVARFGNNQSVLTKRRGNHLLERQLKWGQCSVPETAETVVREYNHCRETTPALMPIKIFVDTIGLGAGVFDLLERYRLPVVSVDVMSERHIIDSHYGVRFFSKRDHLAWKMKEWIEKPTTKLEHDDDLIEALVFPRFSFEDGYMKLESKRSMRLRGIKSPDEFDSLSLTFEDEDVLEPSFALQDRYKPKTATRHDGSWMSL